MRTLQQSSLLFALVLASASAPGQSNPIYTWRNFAGQPGGWGNADGTGSAARFNEPFGVAVDTVGNIYVADQHNSTIRKVTSNGVVTTLADSAAGFYCPYGVAVDGAGNVYVADTYNHMICKVTSAGVVTTLAGGWQQSGSADGTGSAARFSYPSGVAVDSAGNVYVADSSNHTIRKMTSAGVVTTLAGSAGQSGSANGTGSVARFNVPSGVAVDHAGNVYVADCNNNTIRKVTSGGVVTTLAGTAGSIGSADGTGSAARFYSPYGVAVDGAGNVYVGDFYNTTLRKVTSGGVVTTLAGSSGQYGSEDGTGSAARFCYPRGVAVDSGGSVYVADSENHTIRKVTSAGVVTTLAGRAFKYGQADGPGSAAGFRFPSGVAVDSASNVYVGDSGNETIRKATSDDMVTTLAGSAGQEGSTDGTGSTARFSWPSAVAVDSAGNLFVGDEDDHTIRKVTSAGVVTTLAGSARLSGDVDGTGSAARFYHPKGVALGNAGNLYVADYDNHTIRRVTSGGVVTTLAGSAGQPGSADGTGSVARFNYPRGVALDSAGNVFVADSYNQTIRKVTSAGVVTTLAGKALWSGSTDGTGGAARFNLPYGVAVDGAGNVYVADYGNSTIRKVTSAGVVTTIGGTAGLVGGVDGVGGSAQFAGPSGIAVDSSGCLYVTDYWNNSISKGAPFPNMTIGRSGSSVSVSWPSAFAAYVVQTNGSVANPGGWQAPGYPINDDGTTKSITVTSPTGRLFFRLVGN